MAFGLNKDFRLYIFDSVETIKYYKNLKAGINASCIMSWPLVYGSQIIDSGALNDHCPSVAHVLVLPCPHCKQPHS